MSGALPVYLRLATPRAALDAPLTRLGALTIAALELAGARVQVSTEAGVPSKPREDAISWTLQHDRLLRDLVDAAPAGGVARGGGIVISDDCRTVAGGPPDGLDASLPVLWAAPASCLLDPPATPPAALTLTASDASRLADAGVRAVPLLAWPAPVELPGTPLRVLVAAADGVDPDQLGALVDRVASAMPGRPVIDVVPDVPMVVDGVRRAPLHPWQRTRIARTCDLVLVLGRSASTELLAAEAAQAGAARWRVVASRRGARAGQIPAALAGILPGGLGLEPVEPHADAAALHLPTAALAGWLIDVSAPATDAGREESDG